MHFVGIGAGTAGDVLPCLLVAKVLKMRGHEVHFVTAPAFRDLVEKAGISYIAGGSQAQFDAVIGDPDVWHPRRGLQVLWRHIGPFWRQAYEVLAGAVRPGESVVYGGALALQMRMVQERLGNPAVTIHLAPSSLLSAHDPPVLPNLGWLRRLPPRMVRVLLSLIEGRLIDPVVLPELNRFRSSIGLAPVRKLSRWLNSPEQVVCAFPSWFASPQPDWPARAFCTGFPLDEAPSSTALAGPLAAFLEAGPPPLLFTPGSGMAHGGDFFTRAIETARELGMRALLVTRYVDQVPDLPPSIFHATHAPFDLLVPRVAMLIHHGGIGTIAQGLLAGKPQLVTPFSYDQPDNARRLVQLGVARSVSPSAAVRSWTTAAAGLLHDRRVVDRCAEVANQLRQEGSGVGQIADRIEAAAI